MGKLRAFMNKEVAGIPVYWILLVLSAAALYGAFKLPPKADDTAPTDAQATDGSEGDLPDTSQPVFGATPVITQPTGTSVASSTVEDSNELWGRRAITYLTAQGFTLQLASNAISKYLDGDALSLSEGQARDKAVAQFGIPPEGILPTTASTTPGGRASRQGVPPLNHVVKNRYDDTPRELALLYYGSKDRVDYNTIIAANATLPVPYPSGTSVRVPGKHRPQYYRARSSHRTLNSIASANGTTAQKLIALNPRMGFPVLVGTRVRVR